MEKYCIQYHCGEEIRLADTVTELREKVALSCRILAQQGLVSDILGHVSARIPGTNEMLIRCRGDEEYGLPFTTPSAIRQVDFDGHGDLADGRYQTPLELPIHGEIFKVRPDVQCVVHAHPPAAVACGIAGLELRPIIGCFNIPALHMALAGIPVFPRAILINRPEVASQLLAVMGQRDICLMKGHGITVTGRTIEEATTRAINIEMLARMTLEVAQTGRPYEDIPWLDIQEFVRSGRTLPEREKWVWRFLVRQLPTID